MLVDRFKYMLARRNSRTSLPPELSRIAQLKIAEIQQHFAEIDTNIERRLSFEEIYAFLCGKSGGVFERSMLEEIYSRLDKGSTTYISIKDFAQRYAEMEVVIQRKFDDLRVKLSEDRRTIDDHRRKMLEAKATTQYNSHGIMLGSSLTVEVLEVTGLQIPTHTKGVRVSLGLEGQTYVTETIPASKKLEWNQAFKFTVETGLEVLHVDCSTTERKSLGEVQIPLQNLKKQDSVEQLFDLVLNTTKWNGKILLRLQWFWDLAAYHESMANEWSQRSSADQSELQQLEGQLEQLRRPFGKPAPSLFVHPQVKHVEQLLSESMDTLAVRAFGGSVAWYRFFLISTMLVLSLSSIVMYSRPDFLSFVIAIVAYYFLMEGRRKSAEYKYLSLGVLVSLVNDLVWFTLFTPIWYENSMQPENLHSVESFGLCLSVLNFFLKIVFALITWRHGMELTR